MYRICIIIHNVCMPCHHPCVFVCVQMLCLFRKIRSQVQGRYVTLSVELLKVTKKGESAWLLMLSDTVTKETLLSMLVNSKTPLQINQ